MLISDTATLAQFCERLRGVPYVAVDTEFMGEKTFFARLCLIQVAHGEVANTENQIDAQTFLGIKIFQRANQRFDTQIAPVVRSFELRKKNALLAVTVTNRAVKSDLKWFINEQLVVVHDVFSYFCKSFQRYLLI